MRSNVETDNGKRFCSIRFENRKIILVGKYGELDMQSFLWQIMNIAMEKPKEIGTYKTS